MSKSILDRRLLLQLLGMGSTSAYLSGRAESLTQEAGHLAVNQYPWMTFYRRENRDFLSDIDHGLAEVASSGIDGYEPLIEKVEQLDDLTPRLRVHNLEMRSLYVNSLLHEKNQAELSIERILNIAEKAQEAGTRIIVTNPSPIRWGGPEDKSDDQLETQAQSLTKLGTRLGQMGLTLAYHNHDIELRNAAREFHHMMIGTDPDSVKLCLDAHWIYRGSGNSQVALFDITSLYAQRVVELHLRQSRNFIWSEVFGEGDIDYKRLFGLLAAERTQVHYVLEQAVEEGSPHSVGALESHRRSNRFIRTLLSSVKG